MTLGLVGPPLGIPPEAGFLTALLATVGFLVAAAIAGKRQGIHPRALRPRRGRRPRRRHLVRAGPRRALRPRGRR